MSRLTAAEREVILTVADDEPAWHVHTDSARFSRRLLRIAGAWSAQVEQVGQGFRFTLPLEAVRFSAQRRPRQLTAREQVRRERARAVLQEARLRASRTSTARATESSGAEEVS